MGLGDPCVDGVVVVVDEVVKKKEKVRWGRGEPRLRRMVVVASFGCDGVGTRGSPRPLADGA